MGMLDFLKHDPEDEYDFDDEFDDEELDDDDYDDDDDVDDFEDEVEKAPAKKESKKPILSFTDDEEEEISALMSRSGSRFSQDYKSYLRKQVNDANNNLRRRTAEALEMIREIADQPAPYGSDMADDYDDYEDFE